LGTNVKRALLKHNKNTAGRPQEGVYKMSEAVIVSAVRTPLAKERGSLAFLPPDIFGGEVVKEAVKRSGLKDLTAIDEVIFGCCLAFHFGCMARHVSLRAGLPISVPGLGVDRQCGSGPSAINVATANILAGLGDIYVAGGTDSMTRTPYVMERAEQSFSRMSPVIWADGMSAPPEIGDPPMGITAENVAAKYNISREEQDDMGYLSQIKAERAIKEGRFKEQIVPIMIPQKKSDPVVFDTDECPRFGTKREALTKLRPAYKADGCVTAGNASGICDGAAAVVMMSKSKSEELGIAPMAKIIGVGQAGVDPNIMGMGPVFAVPKALAKAGLTLDQIDVIEMNEAFSAQSVACCNELGINWRDEDRFNPNGGAIALGHPIGATLAIITVKALYELKRTGKKYALITACCGGGQGVATIIENI
jgi:acetyl-CoA C-acetyltransferase